MTATGATAGFCVVHGFDRVRTASEIGADTPVPGGLARRAAG